MVNHKEIAARIIENYNDGRITYSEMIACYGCNLFEQMLHITKDMISNGYSWDEIRDKCIAQNESILADIMSESDTEFRCEYRTKALSKKVRNMDDFVKQYFIFYKGCI